MKIFQFGVLKIFTSPMITRDATKLAYSGSEKFMAKAFHVRDKNKHLVQNLHVLDVYFHCIFIKFR